MKNQDKKGYKNKKTCKDCKIYGLDCLFCNFFVIVHRQLSDTILKSKKNLKK